MRVVVGLVVLSAGCTPTCETNCKKLLRCDLDTERFSRVECEQSCEVQRKLYNTWEDQDLITAFKEHRQCIGASTCEELAAGECYDPQLFQYLDGTPDVTESTQD